MRYLFLGGRVVVSSFWGALTRECISCFMGERSRIKQNVSRGHRKPSVSYVDYPIFIVHRWGRSIARPRPPAPLQLPPLPGSRRPWPPVCPSLTCLATCERQGAGLPAISRTHLTIAVATQCKRHVWGGAGRGCIHGKSKGVCGGGASWVGTHEATALLGARSRVSFWQVPRGPNPCISFRPHLASSKRTQPMHFLPSSPSG